jgi:pyrroloquinoline-quinone synthase
MDFFEQLHAAAERWDVLRHPFYLRWSAGELTRPELATYAGQYAHAVSALAAASRRAADCAPADTADELAAHAEEEEAHVALWDRFAAAVGGESPAPALPETEACAAAWGDPQRPLLGTLVALYAIESAQPAISEVKGDGLRRHYGVAEGPATAYFDVHAVRDVEHARAGRRLIERELDGGGDPALVGEAERVLAANWGLLDGVERAA